MAGRHNQRFLFLLALGIWPFAIIAPGPCLRLQQRSNLSLDNCSQQQNILVFEAQSSRTRLHSFTLNFKTGVCPFNVTLSSERTVSFPVSIQRHASYPELLRKVLIPLIDFAKSIMPRDMRARFLAVMRFPMDAIKSVTRDQRRSISHVVADLLRRSGFLVPDLDSDAAGTLFHVDYTILQWVATNFLMGAFHRNDSHTRSILHVGNDALYIVQLMKDGIDFTSTGQFPYSWPCGMEYRLQVHVAFGMGVAKARFRILGYEKNLGVHAVYNSSCLNPAFTGTINSARVVGSTNVTSSDRARKCDAEVLATVRRNKHAFKTLKAHIHDELLAVDMVYRIAKLLGKLSAKDVTGKVTLRMLEQAKAQACANTPAAGSQFEPYICMDATHLLAVLRWNYGFTDAYELHVAKSIVINGTEATWALGYAIQQAVCSEFFRKQQMVSAAQRGAVPDRALSLTLALGLCLLSFFATFSFRLCLN